MSNIPFLINEANLSHAWARTLLHVIDHPGKTISPLIISITDITDGQPQEDNNIRLSLDKCLKIEDKQKIQTVANTIFPQSLWRRSRYDRANLFERYLNHFLPRAKELEPHKNKRGLYFERLIAFGKGPCEGNQLEHIISQYRSRPSVRRSMLQASIFDPERDHIASAQIPFPCLQHVSFVPEEKDSLILNAFYATQQLFHKSYGNYLGLCRLGNFMATEMGLRFSRMNCFIGVAKLEKIGKNAQSLIPVIQAARNAVSSTTN